MDPAEKYEVLALVKKFGRVGWVIAGAAFFGADDVTLVADDSGSIVLGCVHDQIMLAKRALIPRTLPDQLACLGREIARFCRAISAIVSAVRSNESFGVSGSGFVAEEIQERARCSLSLDVKNPFLRRHLCHFVTQLIPQPPHQLD
jgi:hypothetical protein